MTKNNKMLETVFRAKTNVSIASTKGTKHIAVLYGGMSSEREVSLVSGKGVIKALVENGYQVTALDMGADLANVLQEIKPDLVFNCLHGTYGEDGSVPGLLNILKIPYTHSGVLSSAVGFNKEKSKEVFRSNGIPCAEGVTILQSQKLDKDPIARPYVIKPLCQGSSVGVEIIFPDDDFNFANYHYNYGDRVLIEKYVKGKELQVAVLNGKALGVLEIKVLTNRFYDYEAKYTEGLTEHIMPAKISQKAYDDVMNISSKIYYLLNCNGMIRAEFIYDDINDKIYTLEVNTHPGMTPLSICPEIAAFNGINYNELVDEIVKTAKFES